MSPLCSAITGSLRQYCAFVLVGKSILHCLEFVLNEV